MAIGAKEKSVFLDITLVFCGVNCVCTHTQNTHTQTHTLPMNGRKEGNVLFNDTLNILFTVIWCQTCGKGPCR